VCAGFGYSADFVTGQAARAVIGQATYRAEYRRFQHGAGSSRRAAYAANTLFAADSNRVGLLPNNNRVLIFNNIQQQLPAADAEIRTIQEGARYAGAPRQLWLASPISLR